MTTDTLGAAEWRRGYQDGLGWAIDRGMFDELKDVARFSNPEFLFRTLPSDHSVREYIAGGESESYGGGFLEAVNDQLDGLL